MAEQGFEMVRYADDFVILCRTREEAERALALVQGVDRRTRADAAPDEDANRGCRNGRLRISGLPIREASSLPAEEEPGQVPGRHPRQDATDLRPQPERDHCRRQSDAARLV